MQDTNDVNTDRAAALLANIQRTVGTPKPAEPEQPASAKKKPARRASAPKPTSVDEAGEENVSMQISLNPGKGQRVVYIRVDKTLADRLQLIAFQNKIAGGDGPTTVNEIGIEALTAWLNGHTRQAA
jgi:hypothetical protein